MTHWLSCSTALGIFLDQGLNQCLLHWHVDSSPLSHQGSPPAISLESPPFPFLLPFLLFLFYHFISFSDIFISSFFLLLLVPVRGSRSEDVLSKLQSPSLHGPCKEPCLGSVFTWSYYSVNFAADFWGYSFP